jgi:phosphoribosylformylglycinamidine synthase
LLTTEPRLGLSSEEVETVRRLLGREPNETEWAIIDAEWAEHSSYKSSRALLKQFPTSGKRVVLGPGFDAGVVDVGKGYVVTLHIESHNHPSAIDPYGGASTGIGGVLRDIISVGSRPIALVDVLRFGNPEESGHSRWLFRNVVRGIADYGNCVGVPTVAGDIEFDDSFEKNCLVDVACVGVARKGSIILGEAKQPGDVVLLIGGSTGRDGVGGATFASKNLAKGLESGRRSVQVPDPFMKKLLLDALLEVCQTGLIRGMKDLGGGGLSTALSEIASKGGTGVDVELTRVGVREPGLSPAEIMTSESQERMILVLDSAGVAQVIEVLDKYEVPHEAIGKVTSDGALRLRWKGQVVVDLPVKVVTEAPLVRWPTKKPSDLVRQPTRPSKEPPATSSIMSLLSSPNIASRRWVYEQYDYEVGLRTVLKPGNADAALLRLPNGSMLAVKADGNSKHSFLDSRRGAAGCVAEACRNVVSVGAKPIAAVDHLQFGDPSDREVYWAFTEAVEGMAQYCRDLPLPVVGGKVSFYNEDTSTKRAIKPSPVAMVVGLLPDPDRLVSAAFALADESIFIVGDTTAELGGSEYYETVLRTRSGVVPTPDARKDSKTYRTILALIRSGVAGAVHDCSKGGLAVAMAEMCIPRGVGARVDIGRLSTEALSPTDALFSESHGRFVISTRKTSKAEAILRNAGVAHSWVGKTGGRALRFTGGGSVAASLEVDAIRDSWEKPLARLMG